jgi:hypothetical protein
VRRRLDELIALASGKSPTGPRLLPVRAIEVLEAIGAPQAREALAELARGPAELRLTREARAALQRLSRRLSAKP